MSRRGPWQVLGIDPTAESSAIRRAYAAKLKALDIDKEVEAYARLRDARDEALRLAKATGAGAPAELELAGGGDLPAPELAELPAAEEDTGPRQLPPPEVLLAILYPEGASSEAGLTHEEWETASAAVAAIAAEAQAAPIDMQRAIDEWLAHQLASAWPRSAHLVADAAERMGWEEESGQITERPAHSFLNQRRRGMLFVEQVHHPKHRFHRAWKELSREGEKEILAFLGARRRDVDDLLKSIRERYPEVENYLNPVRVASWERPTDFEGWARIAWVGFFLLVFVAKAVGSISSPSVSSYQPTNAVQDSAMPDREAESLVSDLFGDAEAAKRLQVLAPEIFNDVQSYKRKLTYELTPQEGYRMKVLNLVRLRAQIAANRAGYNDLVAIRRIELDLLNQSAVRGKPSLCEDILTGRFIDEQVPADPALRARERKLYAHLLEQGLLQPDGDKRPKHAAIPAFVTAQVLRTTGMSQEAFDLASQHQAGSVDQCLFTIGMLDAVLRQPAKVSKDLLRLL